MEKESLGGVCLNWGCIPTKALLRSAEVLHLAKSAKHYGLKIDKAEFDLPGVVARSRGVAKQLSGGVKHLMKKNKITVIEGTARLEKGSAAPKVIVTDAKGVIAPIPPNMSCSRPARAPVPFRRQALSG